MLFRSCAHGHRGDKRSIGAALREPVRSFYRKLLVLLHLKAKFSLSLWISLLRYGFLSNLRWWVFCLIKVSFLPPQAIPSCAMLPCLLVPLPGSRAASYDFSTIKMSRNANAWWTLGERRLVPRKTSYDWTGQYNPWSVSQILDSVSSFTLPAYQKVLFTLPNAIKGTHTLIPLRPTATTLGKHHLFFFFFLVVGEHECSSFTTRNYEG